MADNGRVSPQAGPGGDRSADEVAAIPLVEERLSVAKRQVESGRVRVHVRVEEREEIVNEQLLREELQIERVPRNERLTEVPHVRLEGNTTIVPVVEEVLVVEKRLVVREELHVRRTRESDVFEERVPVRRQDVIVERLDPDAAESA